MGTVLKILKEYYLKNSIFINVKSTNYKIKKLKGHNYKLYIVYLLHT